MNVMLVAALLLIASLQPSSRAIEAADVRVGAPSVVTELDLGKLKGELRQVGWSPDGGSLYVQTLEGTPPSARLHHYLVSIAGGAAAPLDDEPDWATTFWQFKSDRFAPSFGALMIDFEQRLEKIRVGTGSGRPGEMAGAGATNGVPVDIEKTAEGQHQNVARLTLLGETISEFVNQVPVPGLMFSWGPAGSGAIVYTDREAGRLMLLDQHRHKQTVAGVKDALLPAWSTDGARLAWVQKAGRKKFLLLWATVTAKG